MAFPLGPAITNSPSVELLMDVTNLEIQPSNLPLTPR
jgi:hypothetical protein